MMKIKMERRWKMKWNLGSLRDMGLHRGINECVGKSKREIEQTSEIGSTSLGGGIGFRV